MTAKEIAERCTALVWGKIYSDDRIVDVIAADIDKAIAEALEQAAELACEHSCATWPECCNCGGFIAKDIRALIGTRKDGDK